MLYIYFTGVVKGIEAPMIQTGVCLKKLGRHIKTQAWS
ncbi:hypothetical protein TOT_010000515 [Theileria orientalis strain Shintoku]|uniref:Uncharacterized protein n=1 Tax=Theileria orientalis strain Shintoku TaxID=869250 RepID=J4CCA5_THEOR|nr:hypothetical protein TOT_010000515 [Theileria orientalis strain Shintoku]PVC54066.1 hypothetical protein MACL_00003317 [Theileria orientalis]BAM39052.1 hypothetical protein TOT_010000515 [Theileria orientalis strain Shintoku]|eukprot:XP_009689353.1 hypothetical protein TOT_010000515 [Theileria orientalis strain Shintoku]